MSANKLSMTTFLWIKTLVSGWSPVISQVWLQLDCLASSFKGSTEPTLAQTRTVRIDDSEFLSQNLVKSEIRIPITNNMQGWTWMNSSFFFQTDFYLTLWLFKCYLVNFNSMKMVFGYSQWLITFFWLIFWRRKDNSIKDH